MNATSRSNGPFIFQALASTGRPFLEGVTQGVGVFRAPRTRSDVAKEPDDREDDQSRNPDERDLGHAGRSLRSTTFKDASMPTQIRMTKRIAAYIPG